MFSLTFVFLMEALASQPFWVKSCEQMIQRVTVTHNDKYTEDLLFAIPMGIHLANVLMERETYDVDNINTCALALAVAKKESTYNPKARNGTCLGLYQITVITAKDIIKDLSFFRERSVKDGLYDPLYATVVFVLLMDKFMERHHTMSKALYRYNNSVKHSKHVVDMFTEIRRIGYAN